MDGYSRKAGSVCNVTNVKNPIKLARIVMDRTTHVIFAGKGAEEIAAIHKLELVD
jgi:beta-aspartyl-peptidase (threonine type)